MGRAKLFCAASPRISLIVVHVLACIRANYVLSVSKRVRKSYVEVGVPEVEVTSVPMSG